ncbi:MAG: efflux RND transporter periplasmic adaptor subunit [Deltaproteobacteria bacterium]|nr:efflux RND transporter periplasmic adaptor subunit [Deltaproteobacteria bacterium]
MEKDFKFKAIRVIIVLAAAIVIAVLLIKMQPEPERKIRIETPLLVEAFPAKAETLNMIIESYGTVKPRELLKLVAEVKGRIVSLDPVFKEGSFIKKGTALIKIDHRSYQLEVDRRRVEIKQAEAELKHLDQEVLNLEASIKIARSDSVLTKAEYLRQKKLVKKNVMAQTSLDNTEQKYLASLERLQKLQNQLALTGPSKDRLKAKRDMVNVLLRQAELDLEKTSIVAAFDGWVVEKEVEKGQHVNAGQNLGKIYSKGAFDIEVNIPIKDLRWLPTDFTKNSMPEAKIIFSSNEVSYTWNGRVARMKAQFDEKTRTLPVVVEVDYNSKPEINRGAINLKPGMFVTVHIKGIEIKHIYVLPRHVLYGDNIVYLFSDNRLRIRQVSILRRFKDSVFINKGLSDGELVIKTPLSRVSDGMQVGLAD